ncbi:MAG TPA: DUF5696 domain-containing protein [Armatimonadota bacterium]
MSIENTYTLQAKNSSLCLTKDGTLTFSLDNQYQWQSEGAFCILHYYDRQHPRQQAVLTPRDNSHALGTAGTPSLTAKSAIHIDKLDAHRLHVTASYESIQITIGLTITLRADGAGFSIALADEEVQEALPRLYRVLGVEILPNFGAARTGEAGYLLQPNWAGCQTFFDKSYPREVRQTIYSSNDQWEHVCNMAVFGITRAQGTLCGMVTEGDCDAQLIGRVHWEQAQTNSVHPYLVYRWQQEDERIAGPREVRYAFAPPDYASGEGYVFCGKEYRNFLMQERGLQSWQQKAAARPEVLDFRDRFFLKIFMAYKDPHPEGTGEYHAVCTFAEVQEILEDCLSRGITNIIPVLTGWGQDGHDGMPPTRFPVDERLGGEQGMRDLIAWCHAHNILCTVHDSYGASYPCSPEHDLDSLIRHRSGEYWESIIWSGGQAHIICPKIWVEKHVKRDMPAIRDLGIHGHHHIDAVGSFMPCYAKDHPLEQRADYMQYVRTMFELAIEHFGSVSTEYPFGPYFAVVDGIHHSYVHPSPWHLASPVGQWFFDRCVPLLTIVLHGSVNCGLAVKPNLRYRLEVLDLGLSPQSEVCVRSSPSFGIPAYADAADMLEEAYHFFYGAEGLLPRLNPLTIEGRWELAPGVNQTLYSDGTMVRVNASDEPYEDLPGGGYTVMTAEAATPCASLR